jgi:hypothetical protein
MQADSGDDTVRLPRAQVTGAVPPPGGAGGSDAGLTAGAPGAGSPAPPPQARAQAQAPRVRPAGAAAGKTSRALLLAGAAALAAGAIAAALWLLQPPAPAPMATAPEPAREAAPPTAAIVPPIPQPAFRTLDEAALNHERPAEPAMVRLSENPLVFVLLFPTLEIQGAALNRMAALIEKAGLPRDRLLTDEELAAAIARNGDSAATWYLGHDYTGTDLDRFFALAARDGIALNPAERWLHERLREARAATPPEAELAMISAANPDSRVDAAMRAAILRHEIGHGHFFTLPPLAEHVMRVWREAFSAADRQAFRDFLAREGYDPANDRLMANEAMAYLVFTPDPRFFNAAQVGMTEPQVERLRALMRDGMPLP